MSNKRIELKEILSARILEVAFSEFAEKGYSGTTIQNIAEKADVSVGVICKYFESKEGLLRTVMQQVTLETIFDGVKDPDPEKVFNQYLDSIKDMQINDPELFDFYYNIFRDTELNKRPDGFCARYLSDEFKGSILEKAILIAQEEGEMPKGNPLDLYLLLIHAVFGILEYYRVIGFPVPQNSFILNAIQFNPGEKDRRQFIEEKEREIRGLSKDLRLMAKTVNRLFPLSIYCNLSKNKYHMLDYDDFFAHKAEYTGTYDELIEAGLSTIEDEADRENFRKVFNRQALLDSFQNGKDVVGLIHAQTGDDMDVRIMYTRAILSKDEDGNVIAISVAYELPEYLLEQKGYRTLIEEFNKKVGRG